MQTVEVVVEDDGSVRVHVAGIKGRKCTNVQKVLQEMLGAAKKIKMTSEYYAAEHAKAERVKR